MSFSPGPSPRKRANTVESPTKAWNASTARTPVERPLSALRSPIKPNTRSPSRIALPSSPMPKFDLSTAIPKAPFPIRTTRGSPKKEVHEYEVPTFDFSMRGNTIQKPPALRRKPLMATAGQAASRIAPTGKTPAAVAVVQEPVSAVGLRVKQAPDVPLPASSMIAPSSRILNRVKQPHEVPLPETPAMLARPMQKAPKSVSPPRAPVPFTAFASTRVAAKPSMRANHMRSSSEASQVSVASLQKLSPGTMKHVAPQLLDKPALKIGSSTGNAQSKRKERQAAKAAANFGGEQHALKSAVEGRGFGLSPTKAAKPSALYIGPAKVARMAVGNGNGQPQSPAAGSPKVERHMVDGEVFLVSSKPMTLQTKLQVSPRNGRAGTASPQTVSPAPKPMGQFTKPIPFGVVKGGEIQTSFSKTRSVSDSTSAAADDERGAISNHRPELERKISESEAHVLAVDPKINHRKPFSGRRSNCVSDSVISNSSKHHESIEYQAKQYIAHTLSKSSLLDVVDESQKSLQKSPLIKSSPIKEKKIPAAEVVAANEVAYETTIKKAYTSPEEIAYQAMIKKAYIDERTKYQVNLGRPRSRHRHGSSGQTQIGASHSRDDNSSEFSVDFLNADKSQQIIVETFTKLNGGRFQDKLKADRQPNAVREPKLADSGNFTKRMDNYPVREPVSPSKKTKLADGGNFAKRKALSPSKRVRALELELPVMPSHRHGFDLSSDHPLSPLKGKGKQPAMSSSHAVVDDDPFSNFDEVDLDDDSALEAQLAYHGPSIEELDRRAIELEAALHAMEKFQHDEVDDQFVDKAAELGLMVELVERTHNLNEKVDDQHQIESAIIRHSPAAMTHTTTHAARTLAMSTTLHQKSSLNSHSSSSISSHKSVRWHPSIDAVGSGDSPVVQEQVAKKVSLSNTQAKISAAELGLQNLFVPDFTSLAGDEALELALLAKSLKAQKGGKNPEFARLLRKLREEIDKDSFSLPTEVLQGPGQADYKIDDNLGHIHGATVGAVGPAPKWNPTVPEFTPRNVKENVAWVPEQGLESQRADMALSADDVNDWGEPIVARHGPFDDPAILSVSPGRQNLLRDPAILSVSPGRMRAMKSGGDDPEFKDQSMSENFAGSLFSAGAVGAVGDPVILSIGHSPGRSHQRATCNQTSGTAALSTAAHSAPAAGGVAIEKTTSVRKRVIWDNPDEPGGREVIILSKKYAEEYLSAFLKNYPLTGQKAKVLPKKRLEDLPRRYEDEIVLNAGSLKPQKLASDAADIQQKLELLLLRKKENRVIVEQHRDASSGTAWGLPALLEAERVDGVLGVGECFED